MKISGIILIIIGIAVFVVSFATKNTTDPLPPENRQLTNASPGWPVYLGAFSMASGVFLLMGRKTKV